MRRFHTLHPLAAVVWSACAAVAVAAAPSAAPPSAPTELNGKQGDVVPVTITLGGAAAGQPLPVGRMDGKTIPFFSLGEGRFAALVGIDLDAAVGPRPLIVSVGDKAVAELALRIDKQNFPVQTLTLPDEMVQLDEPTLLRVKQEQQTVLTTMEPQAPERWWSGAFILPAEGTLRDSFGRRRIINGEPRSPHTGEDISAPEGTKVVASNGGVVRLVADHFFSGKSVFLDHGGGLYTMYFHLSNTAVTTSQRVNKGDVIGFVGATGRATGPHLHWGARLNGARINPLRLIDATAP